MSYHTLAAVAIANWFDLTDTRQRLGEGLAIAGVSLDDYFLPAVTPFSIQTTLLQIFVLGQRTTTRSGGNTNEVEDGRAVVDIEISMYPVRTEHERSAFEEAAHIFALYMARLQSLLRTTKRWIYSREGEELSFGFDHTYPIEVAEQVAVDDAGEILTRFSAIMTFQVTFDIIDFDPFAISYSA